MVLPRYGLMTLALLVAQGFAAGMPSSFVGNGGRYARISDVDVEVRYEYPGIKLGFGKACSAVGDIITQFEGQKSSTPLITCQIPYWHGPPWLTCNSSHYRQPLPTVKSAKISCKWARNEPKERLCSDCVIILSSSVSRVSEYRGLPLVFACLAALLSTARSTA